MGDDNVIIQDTIVADTSAGKARYFSRLDISRAKHVNTGLYQCCVKRDNVSIPQVLKEPEKSYKCSKAIYIFVNDPLHLIAPIKEQMPGGNVAYITLINKKSLYLPCKSTFSTANVTLKTKRMDLNISELPFDPRKGFFIQNPGMKFNSRYECVVNYRNLTQTRIFLTLYKGDTENPVPKISIKNYEDGIPIHSILVMVCSVTINSDDLVDITWKINDTLVRSYYGEDTNIEISSTVNSDTFLVKGMSKRKVTSRFTVRNASKDYEKNYTCLVKDHNGKTGADQVSVILHDPLEKYERLGVIPIGNGANLTLRQLDRYVSGNTAKNFTVTPFIFDLELVDPPLAIQSKPRKKEPLNISTFVCRAFGYPSPATLTWYLRDSSCANSPHINSTLLNGDSHAENYRYLNKTRLAHHYIDKISNKFCQPGESVVAPLYPQTQDEGNKENDEIQNSRGLSEPLFWIISGKIVKISKKLSISESKIKLNPILRGELICRIQNSTTLAERSIHIPDLKTDIYTATNSSPVQHLNISWFLLVVVLLTSIILLTLVICVLRKRIYAKNKKDGFNLNKSYDFNSPTDKDDIVHTLKIPSLSPDKSDFEFDAALEFPKERLILGKCLGEGAYGKVMEADAIGLVKGENKTKIAVKIVRSAKDSNQLMSLISEFKIMTSIGKHLNLVNLMGVCSEDIAEANIFMVLMEFCAHGNLKDHLRKRRVSFQSKAANIDCETLLGKQKLEPVFADNEGYCELRVSGYSSGAAADHSKSYPTKEDDVKPPYDYSRKMISCSRSGASFLECQESSRMFDDEPIARSDINAPLCECKTGRDITVETLLCYAYQISKGMEYLISKNCIHRDLACRNVLLDHDNIVKICDFGLSKDLYRYPNYVKTTDTPVPIKWMAIESLIDNLYNHQTDIWSYGVVLWEIYSLGCSPYPGVELGPDFVSKLMNGLRLEKPTYCPEEIYDLMLECWSKDPEGRPNFNNCSKRISDIISKNRLSDETDSQYDTYNYYRSLSESDEIPNVPDSNPKLLESEYSKHIEQIEKVKVNTLKDVDDDNNNNVIEDDRKINSVSRISSSKMLITDDDGVIITKNSNLPENYSYSNRSLSGSDLGVPLVNDGLPVLCRDLNFVTKSISLVSSDSAFYST
ncbi:unnamed protein product [Gordionus sp. m RMFG-2023]